MLLKITALVSLFISTAHATVIVDDLSNPELHDRGASLGALSAAGTGIASFAKARPLSGALATAAGLTLTSVGHDVVCGDFNGDGRTDIAVSYNLFDNGVMLHNGTANPYVWADRVTFSSVTNTAHALTAGDFDGDGDLDIVLGHSNHQAKLYLNNGNATAPFSAGPGSDISTTYTQQTNDLQAADLDNDQDLDLVAVYQSAPARYFINNGSGVFTNRTLTTAVDDNLVVLADMNMDDAVDIFVGANDGGWVYLNNGTSVPFAGVVGLTITPASISAVKGAALADFNGDGLVDLAVGIYSPQVYYNTGLADPFGALLPFQATSAQLTTSAMVAGDIDNDGDVDLVVSQLNYGQPQVLVNGGAGFNNDERRNLSAALNNSPRHYIADLEDDGDLDILATGLDLLWYRNTGSIADLFGGGSYSDIGSDTFNNVRKALAGKLDANGTPDLVLLADGTGDGKTSKVLLNNGSSSPFAGVSSTAVGAETDALRSGALADFNKDGRTDLLTVGDGFQPRLYLHNGTTGPFAGVSPIDIGGNTLAATGATAGDVDLDGDVDFLVTRSGGPPLLFLNNGSGFPFNGVSGLAIGASALNSLDPQMVDLNRDGKPDLVIAPQGGFAKYVLNNGSADPFNGASVLDASINTPSATACNAAPVDDVNGDGYPDILRTGTIDSAPRVSLNNKTATPFAGVTATALSLLDGARFARFIDVDRDGRRDLVNMSSGKIDVYRNLGNGTFPTSPLNWATVSVMAAMVIEDFDGDGDYDAAAIRQAGQISRFYNGVMNDGSPYLGHKGSIVSTKMASPATITQASLAPTGQSFINYKSATTAQYFLSNDGGTRWWQVRPNQTFNFPGSGSDLRWKAVYNAISPGDDPSLRQVSLSFLPGVHTATSTPIPSATFTGTATPTATPTSTPSSSFTNTPSATVSATFSASPSNSPTLTATPTSTATPSTTPTSTASPTAADTATPTPSLRRSTLGRSLFGPVPVRVGQPLCLFYDTQPLSTKVEVYNLAGDRVATLSAGSNEDLCLQTIGLAPGIYALQVQITGQDGSNKKESQKIAVLPAP